MVQAMAIGLDEKVPSIMHIQLHGFISDSDNPNNTNPVEPDIYLSNSTMEHPASTDYLSQLRDEFISLDSLTNTSVAHEDEEQTKAGLNNVLGRYLNGSVNACSEQSEGE